jgi:CxxC motif-containing protein (DUF1111 family)
MSRRVVLLVAVVAVGLAALGALKEEPLPAELQEKTQAFFKQLQEGKVDEAYDALTAGGQLADKKDTMDMLKAQTKIGLAVYGPFEGLETLSERWASPSLAQGVYLYKKRDLALIWKLTFYKSSRGWQVVSVFFNDQIPAYFEK